MSIFKNVPVRSVQDYWDARPCNLRHSPKPVGTREYFDEVEKRKYFVEPHIIDFADYPRWAGKKLAVVSVRTRSILRALVHK